MAEDSGGAGVMGFIKEHPLVVVGMLFVVVLLVLGNRQSSTVAIAQPGVDPNAGAEATQIELARISAGQAGFQALTGYFGAEQQTAAQRDVALHSIDAAQEVQDAQTAAGVSINATNTAAGLEAAKVSSQTAIQIAQTQAGVATTQAGLQYQTNLAALQTSKDIARAQDNTSIVNGIFGFAANALAFFGL
jgi:hypothetical protein